ncbi:MAG: hypothetical protein C4292_05065 [Nitrososphaera sp.]
MTAAAVTLQCGRGFVAQRLQGAAKIRVCQLGILFKHIPYILQSMNAIAVHCNILQYKPFYLSLVRGRK